MTKDYVVDDLSNGRVKCPKDLPYEYANTLRTCLTLLALLGLTVLGAVVGFFVGLELVSGGPGAPAEIGAMFAYAPLGAIVGSGLGVIVAWYLNRNKPLP